MTNENKKGIKLTLPPDVKISKEIEEWIEATEQTLEGFFSRPTTIKALCKTAYENMYRQGVDLEMTEDEIEKEFIKNIKIEELNQQ